MADVVTVGPGEAIPAPPDGMVWKFLRVYPGGRPLELQAIPDADPEPSPPAGCCWRLIHGSGVRVYIAVRRPFLHGANDDGSPSWA